MPEDNKVLLEDKYEEGLIFSREEWDKLIKWEPVAMLDPYDDAPQAIKDYHNNYVKLWFKNKER